MCDHKPVYKPAPILVKEGALFKRGGGTSYFGRRNWKRRYFTLTTSDLLYVDACSGKLKGCMDISTCGQDALEIQPDDCPKTGSSDATVWRLAIQAPHRRLFVAAATENEMLAWANAFLKVFKANERDHPAQCTLIKAIE
ncbi:Aste57867_19760 [Aphanomyces stellatus]|uniref:Aste57867_19760 protein n=1 Tax=Aphanomyces stellatus TaxID=120398 RepID=A0A485LEI4_9STRA|nr:hypothetical protein As57867_019695 [Aphanomyces stellatus]VFT96458.1 Aste57867_19760 [Aphanomyces stellatus]